MAPDEEKKSPTEKVQLTAVIAAVGNKRIVIAARDKNKKLAEICRQGFSVATGEGKETVYLPGRIEKVNIAPAV